MLINELTELFKAILAEISLQNVSFKIFKNFNF
jgi:hypothetical protein